MPVLSLNRIAHIYRVTYNKSMEFDYLSASCMLAFLLAVPLIKTGSYLDWLILPMYCYSVVQSKWPWGLSNYTPHIRMAIESSQNELIAIIIILSLVIKSKIKAVKILQAIAKLEIALSIMAIPIQERYISGIIFNKSLNGVLIATLLPYCTNIYWRAAGVGCVLLSNSSSAYLALAIVLFLSVATKNNAKKVFFSFACVGALAIALIPDLFFAGHRVESYRWFFIDFSHLDWLVGKGPASFSSIITYRQGKELFHLDDGFLLFAHSEPIQFLWEYGFTMVLPALIAVIGTFKTAQKPERLALAATIAGSIFYYPLRQWLYLPVLFLVLKQVYEKAYNSSYGASY